MNKTLIEIEKNYDVISYEILFKKYSKLIFKMINNFIKAKSLLLHNSEVDDIYQEIALKIFKMTIFRNIRQRKAPYYMAEHHLPDHDH